MVDNGGRTEFESKFLKGASLALRIWSARTPPCAEATPMILADRLTEIEALEKDMLREIDRTIKNGTDLFLMDFYIMSAVQRTLSQSKGFRTMIEVRNFTVAAILVRTQIDTAMRINGLRYLDRPTEQLMEVLRGTKTFRNLESLEKTDKNKAVKMQDAFLLAKIIEEAPWIDSVYKNTSDFVHLSFRHLYSSITHIDDSGTISAAINGEDQAATESNYIELCAAFLEATKLISVLIPAILLGLHGSIQFDE